MELQSYIPAGVALVLALGTAGLLLAAGILLGPKRTTAVKASPFECGVDPIGSPRVRFSVRFYQAAILFLVFDVEAAFMYPWAVWYRAQATMVGFVEMLLFVVVLALALAYAWRKKAIGWE